MFIPSLPLSFFLFKSLGFTLSEKDTAYLSHRPSDNRHHSELSEVDSVLAGSLDVDILVRVEKGGDRSPETVRESSDHVEFSWG